MSMDIAQRCGICRCYMDGEDLFCANCGTENPNTDHTAPQLGHQSSHYSFDCDGCGASMSYDASAQALRCPFCGSTKMTRRESTRSTRVSGVVPRVVSKSDAESTLKKWLGTGFWRPHDAARASSIGKIAAVYVPYWVFEAATHTLWTADSSPAPPGSRGSWYPVKGTHQSRYPDVLIGGSSVLTPAETDSIAPFNLQYAVAAEQIDLTNAIVEEFRVPRKLARPLARGAIETLEHRACLAKVPNRPRNLRLNVQISAMAGRPMLLPVWILAYRYKKTVHRVLINGQSGKIAGTAPFSYGKLIVIIAIVACGLAGLAALSLLAR